MFCIKSFRVTPWSHDVTPAPKLYWSIIWQGGKGFFVDIKIKAFIYTHGKKLGNTSCVTRVNFGLIISYNLNTRFIQKVPGLGRYLKKLMSFHSDIPYTHL